MCCLVLFASLPLSLSLLCIIAFLQIGKVSLSFAPTPRPTAVNSVRQRLETIDCYGEETRTTTRYVCGTPPSRRVTKQPARRCAGGSAGWISCRTLQSRAKFFFLSLGVRASARVDLLGVGGLIFRMVLQNACPSITLTCCPTPASLNPFRFGTLGAQDVTRQRQLCPGDLDRRAQRTPHEGFPPEPEPNFPGVNLRILGFVGVRAKHNHIARIPHLGVSLVGRMQKEGSNMVVIDVLL